MTLVLGTPSALERFLAAELERHRAADPLALPAIVVGETLQRPYLRRRLAELAGGHLNLPVLTFAGLALRLGEAALVAEGRRPLPRLAEGVLAQDLGLAAAELAGGHFDPVARTPGFAAALRRLLRELRQAGVRPEALTRAAEEAGDAKQAALAALFSRYEELRAPFYDGIDCLAAANPHRFAAPALLVYGLWQPAAVQTALLERLAERVPVSFLLPETNTGADAAHAQAREWLAGLGAAVERLARPGEPATVLAGLRAGLFGPRDSRGPSGSPRSDGSVSLVSAPDPPREVVEAARACLAWARQDIGFHEMAVAYRQADRYRPLVASIFTAAGIPLYIHGGTPLSERPLGRRARALLELAGSPLERSAVMELLTDAELPRATRDRYGGVPAATWDAISRDAGVIGGLEQWRERLAAHLEEKRAARERRGAEPPDRLAEQTDLLLAFIEDLAASLEALPQTASWSAHLDHLEALFGTYLAGGDALVQALRELTALEAVSQEVGFERFRALALAQLDELPAERVLGEDQGLFARRGVSALDVHSLRHLRFRAVAVLGLAERSFPPPPRQDPLLLDAEREELNGDRGWRLPLRARGADPEPLQFALAVEAAGERLQLSFARTEAGETTARLPSYFLRAAAESLTGASVRAEDFDGLPDSLLRRVPGGRFAAPSPAEALDAAEHDRTLLAERPELGAACLASREPGFAAALAAERARWRERALTAHDGVLGEACGAALEKAAGPGGSVSPTALEAYATCPYRYFLDSLLGLKPVREPERIERLDPMERGQLVHAVLERFLAGLADGEVPSESRRDEHERRLLAIAERACEQAERRGLTGYPLLWRFDRQAIVEDLLAWYEYELGDERTAVLDRGAYELRLGPAHEGEVSSPLSRDEPLEIAAAGVSVRLRCRIDRIDWDAAESAFRVIDYKTGRVDRERRRDSLGGGRSLQLPLYLLAAAQILGIAPKRGDAEYFHVSRRGDFARVGFSGSALVEREQDLGRLLDGLLAGIRSGDFHAVPGPERKHCRYCDFRSLCDTRVEALAERKSGDERAISFAKLGEVE